MDAFGQTPITQLFHSLTQAFAWPTIILLLFFMLFVLYTLGALIVEVVVERRAYRVAVPQLIAKLEAVPFSNLGHVIASSGLLESQRQALEELVSYLYLPEDARVEVARRLLADEKERYQRALAWTEAAAKIAPMLGLMGTLIPLGPGIIALSANDLETLSSALLAAFDTTIAGLAVAIVCLLVTRLRKRWYESYLVSLEGAMRTLLEKAGKLHEEGFEFPRPASDMPLELRSAPAKGMAFEEACNA